MSDQEDTDKKEPRSVFDGPAEAPEEGANVMDESEEAPGKISPGASKEVTEDGHLKMRVGTEGVDPFDHSPELEAKREKETKDGTVPPDLPETEDLGVNNPTMLDSSADRLKDEMEQRFSEEFGNIKVDVTPAEREAFVRAALHDSELTFRVEIEGMGTTIEVAMPTDEFTNSAAAAAKAWGAIDFIDPESDMQWMLAFQQIHAWYQVRSIDGEPTPWSDYWADGMPKIRELRAYMKDPDNFEDFFQMNAVRWRMLLDAVRVAELKYRLCLRNWRDKSFFTGADTD